MKYLFFTVLIIVYSIQIGTSQDNTYLGTIDPHNSGVPFADRGAVILQVDKNLILTNCYVDVFDNYKRKSQIIKVNLEDYSTTEIFECPSPSGDIVYFAAILGSDGYLYFTGEWYDYSNDRARIFLAKYTTSLVAEWINYFPEMDDLDYGYYAYDLCQSDDGGIMIVYSRKDFTHPVELVNTWVLKTDIDGNLEFTTNLNYDKWSATGWGNITPASDGNYVVSTYSPENIYEDDIEYAILQKINKKGNEIWTNTIKGKWGMYQTPKSTVAKDGVIALAWVRDTIAEIGEESLLTWYFSVDGYNQSGEQLWQHDWLTIVNAGILDLHPAKNGDILGCGFWYKPQEGWVKAWVFRFSPQGDLKWSRRYMDSINRPNALVKDPIFLFKMTELDDERIALTGYGIDSTDYPNTSSNANVLLMVLDSMGCLKPNCEGDLQVITSLNEWQTIGTIPLTALKVNPNPASERIKIQWPEGYTFGKFNYVLQAYDSSGRLIWKDSWDGLPLDLEIDTWPPGPIMLICLQGGQPVANAKILISGN